MGWYKIICESDSHILVDMLNKGSSKEVNWLLDSVVQQIHRISSSLESFLFIHIPREWNKVVDCLAKWAFEYEGNWQVEDWEHLPSDYFVRLKMLLQEDIHDV